MRESLAVLAVRASDALQRLLALQELLQICLEQFDNPTEKTQERVDLLLSIYLSQVELHFDELRLMLQKIRLRVNNMGPGPSP